MDLVQGVVFQFEGTYDKPLQETASAAGITVCRGTDQVDPVYGTGKVIPFEGTLVHKQDDPAISPNWEVEEESIVSASWELGTIWHLIFSAVVHSKEIGAAAIIALG
jgi:hypothetical protein